MNGRFLIAAFKAYLLTVILSFISVDVISIVLQYRSRLTSDHAVTSLFQQPLALVSGIAITAAMFVIPTIAVWYGFFWLMREQGYSYVRAAQFSVTIAGALLGLPLGLVGEPSLAVYALVPIVLGCLAAHIFFSPFDRLTSKAHSE